MAFNTPSDAAQAMTRWPAVKHPMPRALEYLNQCANSWIHLQRGSMPDFVHISRLVVPQDRRGEGFGSAILASVCAVADLRQWVLTVTPERIAGERVSMERLHKFYAAYGFRRNGGRTRNFDTKASLIRYPKE